MNVYAVPMLIAGVLCTVLAVVTWLFRARESINRKFSFFTLALALDAFAFFTWFQFGAVDRIHTWMRTTFTLGFLIPITLILFFFAFTGYDKRPAEKVLGIRAGRFRAGALVFIAALMLLSQFTDLIIDISDDPRHIWDVQFGALGEFLFGLFAVIFVYLFVMAYRGYRRAAHEPQGRFILLIAAGTLVWLLFGYSGAVVFPTSSQAWHAVNYLGTALMAVFYFVAIVNHQSDRVTELNVGLERKVADRTRELNLKNSELEETLDQLQRMQQQVIVQEKMASLGLLVAGLTHEFNTPISAVRSLGDTKSRAVAKLQAALADLDLTATGQEAGIRKSLRAIRTADRLVDESTARLDEIITNLKNFTRLDEAEMKPADLHEGLDSVLAMIGHDLPQDVDVVREYGEIPRIHCDARKLNHVFLNIIRNACQASDNQGRVTITTGLEDGLVRVAIRDTGRGIAPDELPTIFDPGFTTKGTVVRSRLGLSSSRQIVQEHQGRIEVASSPGQGSVFTVVLPVRSTVQDYS
jgi:signal transduction histidine kinase